jgi:hypothetical protein
MKKNSSKKSSRRGWTDRSSVLVSLRLTREQDQALRRLAKMFETSKSGLIRRIINREYERVHG